jgi:hypothetical protein
MAALLMSHTSGRVNVTNVLFSEIYLGRRGGEGRGGEERYAVERYALAPVCDFVSAASFGASIARTPHSLLNEGPRV